MSMNPRDLALQRLMAQAVPQQQGPQAGDMGAMGMDMGAGMGAAGAPMGGPVAPAAASLGAGPLGGAQLGNDMVEPGPMAQLNGMAGDNEMTEPVPDLETGMGEPMGGGVMSASMGGGNGPPSSIIGKMKGIETPFDMAERLAFEQLMSPRGGPR